MNTATLRSLAFTGWLLATGASAAPPAAPANEERVTRSAAGFANEHAADELRDPTTLKETRRSAAEIVRKPRVSTSTTAKGSSSVASVVFGDAWIYDASTDIFGDRDGDGYYRYLRVRFDADTIYAYQYVYADLYISADGTAWEHLYSTNDFAIWGTDPDDDYEIETELVSGYSAGLYDVLLELYDADTGTLLDEYGPNESPDFSLLPLEDSARDGAPAPLPEADSRGGGGALSWLVPALLGAAVLRRRQLAGSAR
jgi:hypothetical protein